MVTWLARFRFVALAAVFGLLVQVAAVPLAVRAAAAGVPALCHAADAAGDPATATHCALCQAGVLPLPGGAPVLAAPVAVAAAVMPVLSPAAIHLPRFRPGFSSRAPPQAA